MEHNDKDIMINQNEQSENTESILSNAEEQTKEVNDILASDEQSSDANISVESVEEIALEDMSLNSETIKNGKLIKLLPIVGAIAVPLVVLIVCLVAFKDNKKNLDSSIINAGLTPAAGFVLTDEVKNMVNQVRKAVEHLYNSNAYITLHVGKGEKDVVYLLYNKDKECYMESGFSSAIAVFRSDNQAVALTNPVAVVEDIHLLRLVERMLALIENGYAEISIAESKSEVESTTYKLVAPGKHNIRKLYTGISEDYANEMLEALFSDYDRTKYTDDYADPEDEDCLVIEFVIGNNNEVGASAYTVVNGFEQYVWWFDGYMELDGYQLDDGWYSVDNDLNTWKELANRLQQDLSSNIQKYIEKNLTQEERDALEEEINNEEIEDSETTIKTNNNGLPILSFERPEGELTEEEKAWWDYIETIHNKVINNEDLTEQEMSDYYALPAPSAVEDDE